MKLRTREGGDARLQVGYKQRNNKFLLHKTKFKNIKSHHPEIKDFQHFGEFLSRYLFTYVHIKEVWKMLYKGKPDKMQLMSVANEEEAWHTRAPNRRPREWYCY